LYSSTTSPEPLGILTKSASARRRRYRLRDLAAALLPGERVCRCGWRAVTDAGVGVTRAVDGGLGVTGVRVCGSVWTCPVCAVKVAAGRTEELRRGLERWTATGGAVVMVTLTIRHSRHEALADNLEAFTRAMRSLWSGRWSQGFRSRHGVVGLVRNLETTWGAANGWHPHAHVLLFCGAGVDVSAVELELRDRWLQSLAGVGLDASSERGLLAELVGGTALEVAGYVSKMAGSEELRDWTAAHELSWSHIKSTRGDRFTPWMLLAATEAGDVSISGAALFAEYAAAYKGRRQLYWSKGLKALLEVAEVADEERAEAEAVGVEVVARIEGRAWVWLRRWGLVPALLEYGEGYGLEALRERLRLAEYLASAREVPPEAWYSAQRMSRAA
jgi:hypothetical protein